MGPLPSGGLPPDQTIEGGAQIRLTASGFSKVGRLVPALLNDALSDGMCIDQGAIGIAIGDIDYCTADDGGCTDGCRVDIHVDSVSLSALSARQLRVRTQLDIRADVPVSFDPVLGPDIGPCTLDVRANNNQIDAIIAFGIDRTSGKLRLDLRDIPALQLNPRISGCSFVGAILNALANVFARTVGVGIVRDFIEPVLADLVEGVLPDPLGMEGTLALESVIGAVAPETDGALELRAVPGGYVALEGGGVSLGVIAGANADSDPRTRREGLASEPVACVPPFKAPDLGVAPARLSRSSRRNYRLPAAAEFRGVPELDGDLVFGISETFFDLLGHHVVTAGGLCLEFGTSTVPQLTVGSIGLVVPSLAELGRPEGDDPVLLVARPQHTLDVEIGDGTPTSPAVTFHVDDLQIDFYAFLFERYVRGFTVSLDLDLGVNLEFTTDASGAPAVLPVLVGLSSSEIELSVLNNEFLREDRGALEAVIPSILDLALPLVADRIEAITLPAVAGFEFEDLAVERVSTVKDEFLAVHGRLSPSAGLAALTRERPAFAAALGQLDVGATPRLEIGRATARLSRVETPGVDRLRGALVDGSTDGLPAVVFDVDSSDDRGQALEWSWSLNGGMWRPFSAARPLVVRDPALAIQGRHRIELRARAAADPRAVQRRDLGFDVVIDSVGPTIYVNRAMVTGGALTVPVRDLVSPPAAVAVAFGGADDTSPRTGWILGQAVARLDMDVVRNLADEGGRLRVFARDETGNVSTEIVDSPALESGAGSGAGCTASGRQGGTGPAFAVLLLTSILAVGRPRRRSLARTGAALVLAGLPGCTCGGPTTEGEELCEESVDCAARCDDGQVPICNGGECLCADDLAVGRVGEYSEMAVDGDDLWISAYNDTFGDLMVTQRSESGRIPDEAWQFVDGVPAGPVALEGSDVRGGIEEPGDDVGAGTDVAVGADHAIWVSYFDRSGGALKVARRAGDTWAIHAVDQGATPKTRVGQYSAISVRSDGRPGIAYFAQFAGTDEPRTELRFAEARRADPSRPEDWETFVIDQRPTEDDEGPEDPLTIPQGVGLFVAVARRSDDTPVVVYYDRTTGDLKAAWFDAAEAAFVGPRVLAGSNGDDVGWYPSLAVDAQDGIHVSYRSASRHNLFYVEMTGPLPGAPQVIDDGYRESGTTSDGLPIPEYHFVGDDSAIVLTSTGPAVAYQDATTHELLLARRQEDGTWERETVAGAEEPFAGGYGFYAGAAALGDAIALSSWVIDQPRGQAWVELFRISPGDGDVE